MRLVEVVLTEGRGRPIDRDTVIEKLKGEFSHAFQRAVTNDVGGLKIFRGVDKGQPFLYYDTASGAPRRNSNTEPFVNEILDASPYWKGWPRRSRSLICSTDLNYAENYGEVFIVLPKNGTLIGEVHQADFWMAFNGEDWGLPVIDYHFGVGEMEHVVRAVVDGIRMFVEDAAAGKIREGLKKGAVTGATAAREKIKDIAIHRNAIDLKLLREVDDLMEDVAKFVSVDVLDHYVQNDDSDDHDRLMISSRWRRYLTERGLHTLFEDGFVQVFMEILKPNEDFLTVHRIENAKKIPGEVWMEGEAILIKYDDTFWELAHDIERG